MTKYYVIDHAYAVNNEDFCRITLSDMDRADVIEILTAIQFYWEDSVDECSNPALDDVLEILHDYFGFGILCKNDYIDNIKCVLSSKHRTHSHELDGDIYEYIDLYSTREILCGPGQPEKLYSKWLIAEGIKDDIVKCQMEF